MTHHLAQFITGHGNFGAYLHKFKRRDSEECGYCGAPETAGHVVLECPRWHGIRHEMNVEIGTRITADNIIPNMLDNPTKWQKITNAIVSIMRKKEEAERNSARRRSE